MKNSKKYLNLMLSIALCGSFHAFAMEKERSRASHEWSEEGPIGQANVSSESGIDEETKAILEAKIRKLQTMENMIIDEIMENMMNPSRKNAKSSDAKIENLAQFLQAMHKITIMAKEMALGLMPVNTQLIDEKIDAVINYWDRSESSTESSYLH